MLRDAVRGEAQVGDNYESFEDLELGELRHDLKRLGELVDKQIRLKAAFEKALDEFGALLDSNSPRHRAEALYGGACLYAIADDLEMAESFYELAVELLPSMQERGFWDSDLDSLLVPSQDE